MTTNSPRVVALSWAVAMVVWPLIWWLLAAAQGVGVILLGGEWIGISVPLGGPPWAIVNEPGISFAISRGALFGYWLAGSIAAAVVALVISPLLPSSSRWLGELVVFHIGLACAALGLAWAPAIGLANGMPAGLERFWELSPAVVLLATVTLAAAAVQLLLLRLTALLWDAPGGPLRRRRILAVLVHAVVPTAAWWGAALGVGWSPGAIPPATAGLVLVAALLGSWLFVPRHPRSRRPPPTLTLTLVVTLLGIAVALTGAWFGAPRSGRPQALLWGAEGTTSNRRPDMVPVTPRHDLRAPREPSAEGS